MSGAAAARTGKTPSGLVDELIERLVLGGLVVGGVALALAAVAPLLAVALPAWVAWRLVEVLARRVVTRWRPQVGVLPSWVPLVGAALVAGAEYAVSRAAGRSPLGFVDLQVDTGKAMLDAAIDAHKAGRPLALAGMAPAAFALNYVHRVWPYALPGGLALALVTRFNTAGLAAIEPRHGGGPPVVYDATVRERILRAFRRTPDREQDGTATWSLTTLQRALRRAPDGLPRVSTWLIFHTLHEAGYTWQESRTWCHTGYGFHALALS